MARVLDQSECRRSQIDPVVNLGNLIVLMFMERIHVQNTYSLTARILSFLAARQLPLPQASVPLAFASALAHAAIPSIDGDFGNVNPYPTSEEFLQHLHDADPRLHTKGLPSIAALLAPGDIIFINELNDFSGQQVAEHFAGISLGNADYIIGQIRHEMKWVRKSITSK